MSDLLAAFLDRLAPEQRRDPDAAAIERALAAAFDAGHHAWPTVTLSRVEFAHHLGGCVATVPASRPEDLGQLCTTDLYLAAACVLGRRDAIAGFRAVFLAEIEAPLRRIGLRGTEAHELVQDVLELILVGPAGTPAISRYAGRGSMRGWVRSVTVRTAAKQHRSAQQDAARTAQLGDVIAQQDVDIEMRHFKQRYAADLAAALSAALAELEPVDRNLLRHYFIDGLSIDELGRLLGVHRSTAARAVLRARERLHSGVVTRLERQHGLSPSEVDAVGRFVQSQIDLSLAHGDNPEAGQ